MTVLHTPRLRLEPINDSHYEGLQAMNRRPEVMRYISGAPETPEQTREMIERVQARWAEFGFSWWAFIHLESGRLAGAGCIQYLDRKPGNPHEIGWRLHPDFWHQGLASEAAGAMAAFAFEQLQAPELVAVRHPDNRDSAKVMERLGMQERGLGTWYEAELMLHGLSAAQWRARPVPPAR